MPVGKTCPWESLERQGWEMMRTPGLSFVEAILWQLDLQYEVDVWEVALCVLRHMGTTLASWGKSFTTSVSEAILVERADQFCNHGLAKILQFSRADAVHYDVALYLVCIYTYLHIKNYPGEGPMHMQL